MSDSALVLLVLLVGGVLYMVIFMATTIKSVRESDANDPPSGLTH